MKAIAIHNVTAATLMQRDVITVTGNESLQTCLELMTENHVTGLAVLDNDDRCIGVVSASDLLEIEQERGSVSDERGRFFDPDTGRWEAVSLTSFRHDRLAEIRVSEIMSSDLVSVPPDASLIDVCRALRENEVHRLLIVDANQSLFGIISSTDVVECIAQSAN